MVRGGSAARVPPIEGGDTCARLGPGWCVRPRRARPGRGDGTGAGTGAGSAAEG